MANLFGLFGDEEENREVEVESVEAVEAREEGSMQLREEELDVYKDRVQTGEVMLHKDVVEQQKTVEVPVTHEEVVVERHAVTGEVSDAPIGAEETIRVPVSEDRVHVDKHTVVTGEVGLHKRAVQETETVSETLKREEAHVETTGAAEIVEETDLR